MSNDFDEMMGGQADALLVFQGEWIVYRPLNGSPRSIQAILIRQAPAELAGGHRGLAPVTHIEVLDDYVHGIPAATVNCRGDLVEFPAKVNGDDSRRPIAALVGQNGSLLKYRVR